VCATIISVALSVGHGILEGDSLIVLCNGVGLKPRDSYIWGKCCACIGESSTQTVIVIGYGKNDVSCIFVGVRPQVICFHL
jgi:hypothetical protein